MLLVSLGVFVVICVYAFAGVAILSENDHDRVSPPVSPRETAPLIVRSTSPPVPPHSWEMV